MKLGDITTKIRNLDGSDALGSDEQPLTYRTVLQVSALATMPGDEHMDGLQKARLWNIAQVVFRDAEPELPAEDVALLKERVGKGWPPLVVGQTFAFLEGGVA